MAAKERSHKWKEGASWHCVVCDSAQLDSKIPENRVCGSCAEQDCKEWGDAIAAKNGTK